jgi:histidyl-tRNA synthetase
LNFISLPKGTRDFSPQVMNKRNYIFNIIRKVFEKYGFLPLETPAMENMETLMGKYGEEGDRLIFKILDSGDIMSKIINASNFKISDIAEKALRYDLTVPFARYVVMHRNEITLPFKRYQIQPVWRADRPQKGRYREFYQCDVDVIGSASLINESDLIHIFDEVLTNLKLNDFIIKLNNRKILSGIAEVIGEADKIIDITVAIDKLDKIGPEKVKEELALKGLSKQAIDQLQPLMEIKGSNEEKLEVLNGLLAQSEIGRKGILEIRTILEYINCSPLENAKLEVDITLARGLNYYTGAIFEVKVNNVQMGSICGGGRYDDLTGIFGLPGLSGVGISFGADRIYEVMEELKLFPAASQQSTKILLVNFGEAETKSCLPLIQQIRNAGIKAELFPDAVKMKKQLDYANARQIPYVLLIGSEEIKSGKLTLKDMQSGEQSKVELSELLDLLKS